jgi:hypothetical protein
MRAPQNEAPSALDLSHGDPHEARGVDLSLARKNETARSSDLTPPGRSDSFGVHELLPQ